MAASTSVRWRARRRGPPARPAGLTAPGWSGWRCRGDQSGSCRACNRSMRSCGWALSAASARGLRFCSRACNWVIRLSSASWSACRLSGTSAVTRPLRSRLAARRACWRARSSSAGCVGLQAAAGQFEVLGGDGAGQPLFAGWYSSQAASRRASAEAVWERDASPQVKPPAHVDRQGVQAVPAAADGRRQQTVLRIRGRVRCLHWHRSAARRRLLSGARWPWPPGCGHGLRSVRDAGDRLVDQLVG